jgi:hypothetical protein
MAMLGRPNLRVNGGEIPGNAGYRSLSGVRRYADATAGNITITAAMFLAGWLDRSGPGAGYADTTCTADQLLAALPDLMRGDSFSMLISSSVAFANTIAAGTGMTLAGTSGVAASSTREYLITLLSEPKRTRVCVGTTTNANAVLSNIPAADIKELGVGMLVTGTGVGASAKVTAVNLSAGTVTVDVNSTATADNIALTFTPNFEMRGIRTAGN